MILFIFLFLVGNTRALQCELKGTICTFSGVLTTQTSLYFKPGTINNDVVEQVIFANSTMPVLTDEICKVFPNLKILKAEKLSMERISRNALDKCKKLKSVSFSTNKLKRIDSDLFKNNENLIEIIFQSNLFKKINGNVFKSVKCLKNLSLNENYLTEFPVNQFPTLVNLTNLGISVNNLTDLDVKALVEKFPNLKEIYIHNNFFYCHRLKIIIGTLHSKGIEIKLWEQYLRNRYFYPELIENVECLSLKQSIEEEKDDDYNYDTDSSMFDGKQSTNVSTYNEINELLSSQESALHEKPFVINEIQRKIDSLTSLTAKYESTIDDFTKEVSTIEKNVEVVTNLTNNIQNKIEIYTTIFNLTTIQHQETIEKIQIKTSKIVIAVEVSLGLHLTFAVTFMLKCRKKKKLPNTTHEKCEQNDCEKAIKLKSELQLD